MKYAVILGDGMADRPAVALNGKTPLEVADIPVMHALAAAGETGLFQTVPASQKPGSDVANLSVLGYDPDLYYTGRSPLEALSMGVNMTDTDIALRLNLVTLTEQNGALIMQDYSAGEISSAEAAQLLAALQDALGNERFHFYAGVSYRHCLIDKAGSLAPVLTPPHDISGQPALPHLPKGEGADALTSLIHRSHQVLKDHPVNLARRAAGKNEATHLWLWGAGTKPQLPAFQALYGLKGTVISAVDLLKGIAVGAGMEAPAVAGATGTLSTNFVGKTDAVIDAFRRGQDFVYLHLEAPDECGHQGDLPGKIAAIEQVNAALCRVWTYLAGTGEDYAIALLPDHSTPVAIKTHGREAIPYVIYKSNNLANSGLKYSEKDAQNGVFIPSGTAFMQAFLQP